MFSNSYIFRMVYNTPHLNGSVCGSFEAVFKAEAQNEQDRLRPSTGPEL